MTSASQFVCLKGTVNISTIVQLELFQLQKENKAYVAYLTYLIV